MSDLLSIGQANSRAPMEVAAGFGIAGQALDLLKAASACGVWEAWWRKGWKFIFLLAGWGW